MIADRPILFSGPMVRALLDGRKTQTRRILSPSNCTVNGYGVSAKSPAWRGLLLEHPDVSSFGNALSVPFIHPDDAAKGMTWDGDGAFYRVRPRIEIGDRLCVKETWRDEHPIAIQQGRYSQPGRAGIPGPPGVSYRTIYRADGEPLQAWRRADGEHPYFTLDGPADEIAAKHPTVCSTFDRADGRGAFWNSSRYMPRWASRLTLTVTDVRVQRLHDISREDAKAEGFPVDHLGNYYEPPPPKVDSWQGYAVASFALTWSELNGSESWYANPWVVAVSFTVARRNIDA